MGVKCVAESRLLKIWIGASFSFSLLFIQNGLLRDGWAAVSGIIFDERAVQARLCDLKDWFSHGPPRLQVFVSAFNLVERVLAGDFN